MAAIPTCGLVTLNHEEDYKQILNQRAKWLRAAVLGANDGLVSVAALMMGIGTAKADVKVMLLAGFAGTVAGACSMAIGEFVSVYSQYEVEAAQMKREMSDENDEEKQNEKKKDMNMKLSDPFQAAFASALSFSIGALVPLLAAAFITNYKIRLIVVVIVATLALTAFGYMGAVLGKTNILRSCVRLVFGGWIAMFISFGLTTVLCSWGLELYG